MEAGASREWPGTRMGQGASGWKSESRDLASYGATREAGAFWEWRGTWMGQGASEWKSESRDLASYVWAIFRHPSGVGG